MLFCSCQNEGTKPKEKKGDNFLKEVISVRDSLDTDTSTNYITSNFPQDVNEKLYSKMDSLWAITISGYGQNKKNEFIYDFDKLKNNILQAGFLINNTSSDEMLYYRNSFNIRRKVVFARFDKKIFSSTMFVRCWYAGKKYETMALAFFEKIVSDTSYIKDHETPSWRKKY